MKRACILFFYDNDGIADEYNFYNIKELKTVCDYLLIVINGKLAPESRNRLADVCDDMFVRRNEGFDSWAYKDGIEYIGYDGLKEFDELILTNNTMFGPLRPLKDVFAETEGVKCDFWGLQMNYGDPEALTYLGRALPWGYKPDAVITNFRVIRKNMLHSIEFKRYWQKLPPINDYTDAVFIGELQFSFDMVNAGFVMYTLDKGEYKNTSPSPTIHNVYDQISRLKIPYFRKRVFNSPLNHYTDYINCSEPIKVLEYVKTSTNYDTDMIWDNLIRTVNQYDFHHLLSLTEILPANRSNYNSTSKIAVIFHAYYTDIFEKYISYLNNFPAGTDIYFTTGSDEKEEFFRNMTMGLSSKYNIRFIRIENTGRDVSSLLIGGKDIILNGNYDYICFMHDKKGIGSGKNNFECIGSAFSDTCFDNIAVSPEYILNILELFDTNPRMGIAVPPPPTHANYFYCTDGEWGKNFKVTCELVEKCKLNIPPLNKAKPPIAPYGTVFWFRTKAFEKLVKLDWKYSDFPTEPAPPDGSIMNAIERAYAYFIQDAGFYPVCVMNNAYASTEFIYLSQNLKRMYNISINENGKKPNSSSQIVSFCNSKTKPDVHSKNPAKNNEKHFFIQLSRSRFKKIAKAILPHGLWEILRRKKCEEIGEKYIKI